MLQEYTRHTAKCRPIMMWAGMNFPYGTRVHVATNFSQSFFRYLHMAGYLTLWCFCVISVLMHATISCLGSRNAYRRTCNLEFITLHNTVSFNLTDYNYCITDIVRADSLLLCFSKSLSCNCIVVVDETLRKICCLFAFTETQTDDGLTTSVVVCHANSKIATAVTNWLHEVVHAVAGTDQVDFTESKQFAALFAFFLEGKDNEKYITSAFNSQ